MGRLEITPEEDAADWGIGTADDTFHPVNPDEPMWTETVWMSWIVPERKMFGTFYPVFRPNIGVQFGGVSLYDDTADIPWEAPIYDMQWHIPLAKDIDLRDCKLPNGMYIKVTKPNRVIEFGYSSDEITIDLKFEALMRPLVSGGESDLFHAGGHLDQPGRVTGTMILRGETIPVDCIAQRDRAWGPRRDNKQPRVAYVYGTASSTNAFLAVSAQKRGGDDLIFTGYYMYDGVWSKMVSGTREVERDDQGRVSWVKIDGHDELGRHLVVDGTTVSRLQIPAYPSLMCVNSLTRFELNGEEAWGEDQDTWSPRRWRDFKASLRA
ncbi:MAG: hypothetical protein AB7V43_04320 [Acidimicrobiia bacterium]